MPGSTQVPKFTQAYVKDFLREDANFSIQSATKKALCELASRDSALARELLATVKQVMPEYVGGKRKTVGQKDVRSVYLIRCRTLNQQPDADIVALFADSERKSKAKEGAAEE